MSAAKRSRQPLAENGAAAALPPAKRTKTAQDQPTSLAFLTDERQRSQKVLKAAPTNGTTTSRINNVDEPAGAARISNAINLDDDEADALDDDVSSSSEEPSSESSDEGEDEEAQEDELPETPLLNGRAEHAANGEDADEDMEDVAEEAEKQALVKSATEPVEGSVDGEQDQDVAPSFGELLQQSTTDFIDVAAKLNDFETSKALTTAAGSTALQAPSANSLGTVLSQALRTNDRELLESCLQTTDLDSIKSTVQRLQSSLVAELMHKLAERLHKRPGRAGPMMTWIQWALIAHGSYLSGQPRLVRQLKSLRQVVHDRAMSLPHLITLKGKLDMLSAQVELRRHMRMERAQDSDSDDDDVDVIYVDGQNDDFSSDEDDDALATKKDQRRTKTLLPQVNPEDGPTGDDDIPLINGVDDDAEMESLAGSDSGDEVNGGFIDDEAEESEGEESLSSEADDVSEDDDDSEDQQELSGSSSEEEAVSTRSRPVKKNSLIRKR